MEGLWENCLRTLGELWRIVGGFGKDCGTVRIVAGLWEDWQDCRRVVGGVREGYGRSMGGLCEDCGRNVQGLRRIVEGLWKDCWRIKEN